MQLLAAGLRQAGGRPCCIHAPYQHGNCTYIPDHYFRRPEGGGLAGQLERVGLVLGLLPSIDVAHYMTFPLLNFHHLDARLCKMLGKGVVVEYVGTDSRLASVEKARNPYIDDFKGKEEHECFIREQLKRWSDVTPHAAFADNAHDVFLKQYFSQVHITRQRVDTDQLSAVYPDPDNQTPVIIHAPTHTGIKGTKYIHRALDELRAMGVQFNYQEVVGVPNDEFLEICSTADIIIDQILLGSHGVFAAECMALGKPVVCYIHDELIPTYPEGFPIINANPETLKVVLEQWLTSGSLRYARGVQSREYAERVHDYRQIGRRMLEVYRSIKASC